MKVTKTIFSDDETKQYIVFGSDKKVNAFSLSQLFSGELFPSREYFSSRKVDTEQPYTLKAVHTHKEGNLAVYVLTANN